MAWAQIANSQIAVDRPISNGLMTKYRDNQIESAPTGQIIDFPLATPPSGFLSCDGSAISRATYSVLFAVIGTDYGTGDGSTTFNIPDRRGEFVRGWDNGAARDPDAAIRIDRGDGTTGNNVGTKQGEEFESHAHGARSGNDIPLWSDNGVGSTNQVNPTTASISSARIFTDGRGGNETRPINVYTNYCIRYTGD